MEEIVCVNGSSKKLLEEGNAHIIACQALKSELALVMKRRCITFPARFIPSGKHTVTAALRAAITQEIDALPESCAVVLLAMGFCGNALSGIEAGKRHIAAIRASDCVDIFLKEPRKKDAYYFTAGLIESEAGLLADYDRYRSQHGDEAAEDMLEIYLEHYAAFALIDTGASTVDAMREKVTSAASARAFPIYEANGKLDLLDSLVTGAWDAGCVVIKPGERFE